MSVGVGSCGPAELEIAKCLLETRKANNLGNQRDTAWSYINYVRRLLTMPWPTREGHALLSLNFRKEGYENIRLVGRESRNLV